MPIARVPILLATLALATAAFAGTAMGDVPVPARRPVFAAPPHPGVSSIAAYLGGASDPARALDRVVRRAIVDDDTDLFRAALSAAGYVGLDSASDDAQRLMMAQWVNDSARLLALRVMALSHLERSPAPRNAWRAVVERAVAAPLDPPMATRLVAAVLADGYPDLADLALSGQTRSPQEKLQLLDLLTATRDDRATPCIDFDAFVRRHLAETADPPVPAHAAARISARIGDGPVAGDLDDRTRLEVAIGLHRAWRARTLLAPPPMEKTP